MQSCGQSEKSQIRGAFKRNKAIFSSVQKITRDLIEVYKYTHNYYDIKSLFEIQEDDRTRGNDFKIAKQGCRRDIRKSFFSLRITDTWNKLL